MFQEIFKGDQGSFKGLLGKSKKDSRGCQVSFLEVSRVFPECLKGVTRKFQDIEDVSKKFQDKFSSVSKMFKALLRVF